MNPPFTVEQFLEIFKNYNQKVFPVQFVLYLLGVLAIYMIRSGAPTTDKMISLILTVLWLWMGIVYHFIFFSTINQAAYLFGSLVILQGVLFLVVGVYRQKLLFKLQSNIYGIVGVILILFSLIVYPVIGYLLGHRYPWSPTFGLPCPTTIFTFGLLLMNSKKTPLGILIVPFVWSIIGFMAAIEFGIVEDTLLLLAGLAGTFLLVYRNRSLKRRSFLVSI